MYLKTLITIKLSRDVGVLFIAVSATEENMRMNVTRFLKMGPSNSISRNLSHKNAPT